MTSLHSHGTNVFKFRWKVTPRGGKILISCGMKPEVKSKWGTSLEGAGLLYIKNANSLIGKNDFSAL